MTTEDARNILMLAAVEEADESGQVLSPSERREASKSAGAPLPANPGRAREEAFLSERARLLLGRILSRHPDAGHWLDPGAPVHASRHPLLVGAVLLLALAVGFGTNELGPEKRINILSFPLLGILAWNLAVYLREGWLLVGRHAPVWLHRAFEALAARRPQGSQREPLEGGERILADAWRAFSGRWTSLSAPASAARLKSLLHLAALILAASAIGGMYVKGIANEYRAVWESTFIQDSEALRPILKILLGPAAALGGSELPGADELEAIRGAENPGENAARWIHWYAITIGIYVLAPRAFLALVWTWRSAVLVRSLPYRETAPRYFARLLATSSGSSRRVALVPYGIDPDKTARSSLVRRLEDEWGSAVEAVWLEPVAFGEEEKIPAFPAEVAEWIPVFSLASTPERETHLLVYETLSGGAPTPVRVILLEATSFDRKASGFSDAGKRRSERVAAWTGLFEGGGVSLLVAPETMRPLATVDS